MDRSEKFWNRVAVRYSQQPLDDEASFHEMINLTQQYLRASMEVLENGCGTGSTAIILAPYVKHIHTVDISSKMIEIARAKAQTNNIGNISFQQSPFEALDNEANAVDVVIAFNLLHLLENKENAVAAIYKSLIPGGLFISNTVCFDNNMHFLKLFAPIGRLLGLMPPVKFFTTQELENCMQTAGFDIEQSLQNSNSSDVFIAARKS